MAKYTGVTQNKDGSWSYRIKKKVDGKVIDTKIKKDDSGMLSIHANKDDIVGLLNDKNVPGDEITYSDLADEILANPPQQGYLTISNALQWRLQYKRVIELNNSVGGVVNFVW